MDEVSINGVDIAVGMVLLISALIAWGRGFVHEILSVASWIGAIFGTTHGYPYLKPYMRELITMELAADFVSGVLLFIVSLAVFSFVTGFITKRVQKSALNTLDRSLGFMFGVLRGTVLVCLAYIAVEWMAPPKEQPKWLRAARVMPLVEAGAGLLEALVPKNIAGASAETAKEAENKARKMLDPKKIFRDMLTPDPKSDKSGDTPGYDRKERTDMERLIQNSR
jgi:membrane protein required for colicin V production